MLIALLIGYLFLGGGGNLWYLGGLTSHEMQKKLEQVVPDKETRRPIAKTVDHIGDEAKQLDSERKKLEKELLAALKRHDTPAEQFHAFEQRADATNADSTRKLLDLRFALRSQLSDAQWRMLFPPPASATR